MPRMNRLIILLYFYIHFCGLLIDTGRADGAVEM